MAPTSNQYLTKLPSNVRNVLADANYILEQGGPAAEQLWSILTALRGPDNTATDSKNSTTALIRGVVFSPGAMHQAGASFTTVNGDTKYMANLRLSLSTFDHFAQHAKRAFEALGLLWGMPNVVSKPAYVPPTNLKTTGTIWEA